MDEHQKAAAFDNFIHSYLALGFGSLPKREIDLFVFKCLMEDENFRNQSNYRLAELLRVPESKIKSLKLNSALRYGTINSKEILFRIVERFIKSRQFAEYRDGKMEISLEDPLERREIENFLKLNGFHAEHTLNKEVLKISPIGLFELVLSYSEFTEIDLNNIIQNALHDNEKSRKILENAEDASQKITNLRNEILTPDSLLTLISMAFSLMTGK